MLKISKAVLAFSTKKSTTPPPAAETKKKGFSGRRISLLALTAFLFIKVFTSKKKNQMQFLTSPTELNKQIITDNDELNQELYLPTLFLYFSPLQILWAKYIETKKYLKMQKQQAIEGCTIHYVSIKEGDYHKQGTQTGRPCVIVVGGSEGQNQLMNSIMHHAASNKFETIGINVPDFYDTAKLRRVVEAIKKQRKNSNFYAVGIEYGANLMVLAAVEDPNLFRAAVSIGNPLDLAQAQQKAQASLLARYTFLDGIIEGRASTLGKQIAKYTTLPQLDHIIYGLPSQESSQKLKKQKSSINHLNGLKTHTLFLNSKQDPLSIDFRKDERIESNPLAMFVLTRHGGHNQWFIGLKPDRWSPRLVVNHLRNMERIAQSRPELFRTG